MVALDHLTTFGEEYKATGKPFFIGLGMVLRVVIVGGYELNWCLMMLLARTCVCLKTADERSIQWPFSDSRHFL
jgi:hypothetical protein